MDSTNLKQRKGQHSSQANSTSASPASRQATKAAARRTQPKCSAWWKIILRIAVTLVGLNICLSYLITETALWGYQGKWTNWRNYIPRAQRVFTPQELALHDGTDPGRPLLLAIEGDVYDVTSSWEFYGPGSSYHLFAGRDSSRAFGTNCLSREDHLTHDTRGLTESQIAGIKGWHRFFDNHQRYIKVGVVKLEPIDPNSPVPPPCDDAKPKPK
ncbi:cytochrome b5 [Martensiomyces pterosporus]|nr:cytochrome b5 [Martensiomyces pterosporus]